MIFTHFFREKEKGFELRVGTKRGENLQTFAIAGKLSYMNCISKELARLRDQTHLFQCVLHSFVT